MTGPFSLCPATGDYQHQIICGFGTKIYIRIQSNLYQIFYEFVEILSLLREMKHFISYNNISTILLHQHHFLFVTQTSEPHVSKMRVRQPCKMCQELIVPTSRTTRGAGEARGVRGIAGTCPNGYYQYRSGDIAIFPTPGDCRKR